MNTKNVQVHLITNNPLRLGGGGDKMRDAFKFRGKKGQRQFSDQKMRATDDQG